MLYQQKFHSCFKNEDPNNLYDENEFKNAEQEIAKNQKLLINDINAKKIGCLNLDNELKFIHDIATEIKENFSTLLIIGIGGSSLGGQTLCGTKFYQYFQNKGPNIVFLDNIHYLDFTDHLAPLNLSKTAVLMISKSGTTLETITLAIYITNYFKKHQENIGNNFYCITENTDNPLRNLSTEINATILDHPKDIGGRYACFSLVSLIPAAICNVDIDGFLEGAKDVLTDFCANDALKNQVTQGSSFLFAAKQHDISETVFMPYIQKLSFLPSWYVQLFAESLGKKGEGMMPIKAMGSVDQHSVFQLFLDGPRNKNFTIITEEIRNAGNPIIDEIRNFEGTKYLANHTLGDVIQAQQEAIIYALTSCNRPVREIVLNSYSDRALGQIMMHFILEVILLGYAYKIDPFNQPAVEIGKKKTREILAKLN